MDWKIKFDREIQIAVQARQHDNEGQARVCARRAAGVVVHEYFIRRGVPVRNDSAYDLLKNLSGVAGLPEELRQAAEFLTLRVTEEFKLPVEVDLLQAAQTLAKGLLPGSD
jgi:hypothetical protein